MNPEGSIMVLTWQPRALACAQCFKKL